MKRTGIKRGKPLAARKGLRRLSALVAMGKRALREREALETFRQSVLDRAKGRCERCGSRWRVDAHHRLPRSRGGKHELDNGVCCCRRCHVAIHSHSVPDWKDWIL